jgi:glycosyltransferase involved in cell wall biosynthesis
MLKKPPSSCRICLITPGHLSSTPRLVKEADALVQAGYQVHVISGTDHKPSFPLDAALLKKAQWSYQIIDYQTLPFSLFLRITRQVTRLFLRLPFPVPVSLAVLACHPLISILIQKALRHPADLYIGHTLAGLATAAWAARHHQAKLGFDAEDFHSAETEFSIHDPVESRMIRLLESTHLPHCRHLTASSPLIGRAYAKQYAMPLPVTVLNVFPQKMAPNRVSQQHISQSIFRIYWFSQTLGAERGLEEMIDIVCQMKPGVEIHLRGFPADGYLEHLIKRASSQGLPNLIHYLPPEAPSKMAQLAASFDLGLSVEKKTPLNKDFCLANKIFTYLLAGIPQLLSITQAHIQLSRELGEAALLANISDTSGTAALLEQFREDLPRRQLAADTARRLARETYHWDKEKTIFLDSVARALKT